MTTLATIAPHLLSGAALADAHELAVAEVAWLAAQVAE
jgi:hypothetical protein